MITLRFACGATMQANSRPEGNRIITWTTLPTKNKIRQPQLKGVNAPCLACPVSDRKAGRKCIRAYPPDSNELGWVCSCRFIVDGQGGEA